MARIQTYDQDSNVTFQDKLIGTDSATSATKNFTIQSLMDVINQLSGVDLFDGIVFKYQAFEPAATDPAGALNLVGGGAATQAFTATTQIILSKKVVNGVDVENYVSSFLGKKIKVSKQGDFDKFGVFRVTNVQNHLNTRYLVLTVTHKESNGSFEPNSYYFLSFYGLPLVTDLDDVTNAGSGLIITDVERTTLGTALQPADIIDNVTSTDANKALSANQGKVLKDLINAINTLLTSDNVDLDSLQEVVDYIEANRSTLDALSISNIAGLQTALDSKQNTEVGKGLSANDFTTALLTKLNGIAASAEVNVQSNWNEANTGGDAFIQNKPSDLTNLTLHGVTELSDITSAGSGAIITSTERTKLGGIEDSADVTDTANVTGAGALMDSEVTNLNDVKSFDPADYATAAQGTTADNALPKAGGAMTGAITTNSTFDGRDVSVDGTKLDTIETNADVTDTANVTAAGALMDTEVNNLNQVKQFDTTDYATAAQGILADSAQQPPVEGPFVDGDKTKLDNTASTATTIEVAGTANQIEVSPTGTQDLSTDRTFTIGLPNDVTVGNNLTAVGSITGASLVKTGGTALQILLADGTVITLTREADDIDSNDTDTNVPTNAAVKDYVDQEINSLIDSSPSALDTLNELAVALGNDANFSTTITTALGNRLRFDASQALNSTEIAQGLINLGITATVSEINFIDGVTSNVQTQINKKQNTAEAHDSSVQTFTVTVASKTSAHRYNGSGSSSGFVVDGVQSPYITITAGNTYRFDQSDSSNSGHPLAFYYESNKTTGFSSGVTTNGTAGSSGAYTQIIATDTTPTVLHYQCTAHSLMGNTVNFDTRNITGFDTDDLTEGTNLYYTDARFDIRFSTKNTNNLLEGSNLYYTDARVLSKINSTSVDALSDVDTTTSAPSSGQALVWNGTNFVPDTVGSTLTVQEEGSSLTGVATTLNFVGSGVTASGSGGTKTITIGGSIDDLSDVDITSNAPSTGQILKWDGTNFVPGTDNSGSAASDSFTTISVSGQTNVVADSSSDTLTLAAGNNMTITTDTSTDTITLAADGGAGEIVKETFSATGSATFTLSDTISDIDNISVYISGVYQYPSNYTVSGTNITFVSGSIPASGTNNVHVVHTKAAAAITEVGEVFVDQFTGNGNTQFSPLGTAPTSENNTDVYIDGVYQQKNAYSISGSAITFTAAPASGAYIEVKTMGTIPTADANSVTTSLNSDSFTATAGQTSFTLTNGTPNAKELTMVFVQGVYQAKANYNLLTSPTRIELTSGVDVGQTVEVISVSGANLTTSPVTSVNGQTGVVSISGGVSSVNGQTGAVTVASTMGVNVISSDTTATANNLYVLTATLTLTLPSSPSAGDAIKISNRSGVTTCVLAANGNNIMGSSSDLTIDTENAGFEIIYSGAAEGWIIIGN